MVCEVLSSELYIHLFIGAGREKFEAERDTRDSLPCRLCIRFDTTTVQYVAV